MEADGAAEHFDGGLEENSGGGAVDVVVAVDEDGLLGGDGLADARDGAIHAEHGERVEEVADARVEEEVRVSGSDDAAGDEEFGNDWWDVCGSGEGCGFFGAAGVEDPSLGGPGTGRFCGRGEGFRDGYDFVRRGRERRFRAARLHPHLQRQCC